MEWLKAMKSSEKQICFVLLCFMLTLCFASSAMAFTTPAVGSFGYGIYDVVVNKLVKGAPGFSVGIGLILYAVKYLKDSMTIEAGTAAVAGGILVKADAMTTSLGALI